MDKKSIGIIAIIILLVSIGAGVTAYSNYLSVNDSINTNPTATSTPEPEPTVNVTPSPTPKPNSLKISYREMETTGNTDGTVSIKLHIQVSMDGNDTSTQVAINPQSFYLRLNNDTTQIGLVLNSSLYNNGFVAIGTSLSYNITFTVKGDYHFYIYQLSYDNLPLEVRWVNISNFLI